jgi:branched-chain amino acid transport system ATP-binding protein
VSEEVRSEAAASAGDDAVLATDGLTRKFGELTAVDDVSLSVLEGELRAIIGPNGAGKTTLFNLVAGALAPTAGRVRYRGADVTDLPPEERAQRGLARSYQSNQLFFGASVYENVRVAAQTAEVGTFTLDVLSNATGVARERADEVLSLVGLDDERDATAANLSHGDQRKLGIAVALAADPDTLLLDEPTSGMGSEATQRTAELVEAIRDELDLTVLLIEHDMSVVMAISDRISVLHQGTLLTTDTPEAVRANKDVQDAYLGGLREEEL